MGEIRKILHFYPFAHFDTGSPKALASFIDATDRSRFQPVFLTSRNGPLVDALAARRVEIVAAKVAGVEVRHPLRGLAQVARMIRRLRALRPALVHVTGFEWNLDLVIAAWILRIPVLLHVHLPEEAAFNNLHRFAASRVIFCSMFELQNFGHRERIVGKTEVLHNAVDMAEFINARPDRPRFGLTDADICIVTVAQIAKLKGIDVILDTARLLLAERRDLVFLIAGADSKGEAAFATEMRRIAGADPILAGRVRFLGSRQDIPELLASADVFLLPTFSEAFGLVVVESLAAGLPVVVSDVGGVPEIVNDPAIGRMVSDLTAPAFANAVREVLALPDRGRAMGARGRDSVRSRFDSATGGRALNDLYERVLAGD